MDMTDSKAAAHCVNSPSSLPALAECPCHTSAPGGSDAESGTRSHAMLAEILRAANDGGTVTPPPGLTDDERERARWAAERILALNESTAGTPPEIHAEQRVVYGDLMRFWLTAAEQAALSGKFGTVDAWWLAAGGMAHIVDYKTYATGDSGKSYLPQGEAYAVLLASTDERILGATFHVAMAGDHTVTSHVIDLAAAVRNVTGIIRRAEAVQTSGLFRDGEDARTKCARPSAWCGTCAHAATCPAVTRAVQMVESGAMVHKPLAVQMAVLPLLEKYAAAVKAKVREELDAGRRVYDATSGIEYGFALRSGKAKLVNLRGLCEAAVMYGVKPEEIADAVKVSATAIDGLLRAADAREGRKIPKADREAVYSPYFEQGAKERYVKRIS